MHLSPVFLQPFWQPGWRSREDRWSVGAGVLEGSEAGGLPGGCAEGRRGRSLACWQEWLTAMHPVSGLHGGGREAERKRERQEGEWLESELSGAWWAAVYGVAQSRTRLK